MVSEQGQLFPPRDGRPDGHPDGRHDRHRSSDERGLDSSLFETTFVVVDLETTGLSVAEDHIIEIGAVKVQQGQILDTFSSFVDPGSPIPEHITAITGIADADVEGAPQIGTALPRFLEFAAGAVWVAHNAKFDLGFLREACSSLGLAWPSPAVVDTLQLSRRLIDRSKVGRYRLSNLASFVGSPTAPTHRALDDAMATVAVLHYLIELLAGHHVETKEELTNFSSTVSPQIRAKRHLVDHAPHTPGVYIFRSANGDPLYIGTAVDLRRRLLQYFNGSDSRKKITEMVTLAASVDVIECAHGLEAEVREARLLAALRPPYNRQRTEPSRGWYIVAPQSPGKSAKISRSATAAGKTAAPATPEGSKAHSSMGPFRTKDTATAIRDRLNSRSADFREALAETLSGGRSEIEAMLEEIAALAQAHRFQRAALQRDRAAEFITTLERQQRLSALAEIPSLRIAYPDGAGGWHLAEVCHGHLVAAGTAPRGSKSEFITELLHSAAETVIPDSSIYRGASLDELAIIWKWIARPEVRIMPTGANLSSPIDGAGRYLQWARDASEARREGRVRQLHPESASAASQRK
nr:DEDD exonuclease domain-containing protein [Corynebacterium lactis]